jgi:hypothetical protein
MTLFRRSLFAALALVASHVSGAFAVEITPDPDKHMPDARQVSVGAGQTKTVWNVLDINKAHYKADGQIIWMASPLRNPVPRGERAEEAWFRAQVLGVLKGLGKPAPKLITVSTDMSGSSVVADLTPFHANLYVGFPDGSEIVDVIYVEKITRGKGRLFVMLFSTEDRSPVKASAEFAKEWGAKLKDLTAKDWK